MNIDKLNKILENEPNYRIKQAKKAIFVDLASNWTDVTALPLNLREKLEKECPLFINGEILESKDKESSKAIIKLEDELKIETVLMRHADGRTTVCVSSQIGCPMDCKFCATGKMGLKRNLTASEIIQQVLFFARKEKITNVVFMGMGEPFLNYENVLEAIKILNDPDGINIGARKISISTCGIIEGIEKLAEEKMQINLAISLHAPDDKLRSEIMPVNKKYPLKKVLRAIDDYIKKTSRRVMFEYLLINGANDSPEHAEALSRIMRKPLYMVNLIVYNPTDSKDINGKIKFSPSPLSSVQNFKKILEKNKIAVTQRRRFGRDIKAACGQLIK